MIAYIFLISLVTITSSHVLLQSASGVVSRSNFIYWSLNYNGNIIVKLISISGDADLYVSERIAKPEYDPDKYDLHSATCGIDIVEIPTSFKRPVGIGIYGHPSYDNSTYLLEIYNDTETEEEYIELERNFVADSNKIVNNDKNKDESSRMNKIVVSGLWALTEVLELLFA